MRNNRIDIIKGFGIALVVLAHTQISAERIINLFHVGLFFIASGYCFSESSTDTFRGLVRFLKKCVLRLYVPFVVFNGVYLALHNLFNALGIYANDQMSLMAIAERGIKILLMAAGEQLVGPGWFLRALLVLRVLFAVIDYVCKKIARNHIWSVRAVISLAFLLAGGWLNRHDIVLRYDFATVCSVYCLYVFGMVLKKLYADQKWNAVLVSRKWNALWLAAGSLVLIVLNRYGRVAYNTNEYPNVAFFLAGAISGWAVCWALAGLVEKSAACTKVFCFLGERTLSIMLLHLSGFKLVTLAYVLLTGADRSVMAAFPVASSQLWPGYLVVGLLFPICLGCIWDRMRMFMQKKGWLKKPGVVAGILILAVVCTAVFAGAYLKGSGVYWNYIDYSRLDSTHIYNEEYYLTHNPDVAEAFADGSGEEVFGHFVQFGMAEGRVASEEFNITYYRATNPDLESMFGDDLKKYYAHFAKYGYEEGRPGAYPDLTTQYDDSEVCCLLNEENQVVLTFEADGELVGQSLCVYELKPWEEALSGREPVWQGIAAESNEVLVPFTDVTSKYVVTDGESGEALFGAVYITNPEQLCENPAQLPEVNSKKGLQMTFLVDFEDLENLSPSYIFTNLFINDFMTLDPAADVIVYECGGEEYYFRRSVVESYDAFFSRMTNQGIRVCASILLKYQADMPFLFYPDVTEGAAFYGYNTSHETGANFLKAFVSFLSERYDGNDPDRGMITKWMVGNEVNDSGVYNNVGTMELQEYIEEYGRTFRIVYNVVKSNIPQAEVYIVMEPWWGITDYDMVFGGQRFLDAFNAFVRSQGNMSWGLAYHAYSFPLCDPKVLNDDESALDDDGVTMTSSYRFTVDDVLSTTITMENIDVLTEYMHRDVMLTDAGEIRSVILSEQGYTSNSNLYGKCEAEQAASLLFAYYKAEMNEDIDAFIYFLQVDFADASLGNAYYQFGLSVMDEQGLLDHKLSYDVFRVMDTQDAPALLEGMLEILNITDWSEEIPYFNAGAFAAMRPLSNEEKLSLEQKTDISGAVISAIPDQSYTGSECLPEITVSVDGRVLENDVDYDVVYQNNIEQGEATVIVVGLNEYGGMARASFTIG